MNLAINRSLIYICGLNRGAMVGCHEYLAIVLGSAIAASLEVPPQVPCRLLTLAVSLN